LSKVAKKLPKVAKKSCQKVVKKVVKKMAKLKKCKNTKILKRGRRRRRRRRRRRFVAPRPGTTLSHLVKTYSQNYLNHQLPRADKDKPPPRRKRP
jgi:hypothetical protein